MSETERLSNVLVSFVGPLLDTVCVQKLIFVDCFSDIKFECVFTCFFICSNRWHLKKHCISAGKHVFWQGQPFTANSQSSWILQAFCIEF